MIRIFLTAVVVSSSVLFAATGTTDMTAKASNQYYLNAGAALLTNNGSAMPGVAVDLTNEVKAVSNLYYGWAVGAYAQSEGAGYALIPLMAKINMAFQTTEKIQTVVGLSTGVAFATAAAETARFALFFEPGANIAIAKNLNLAVLPKFGVLSSSFVFNPQLGVQFPL